MVFNPDWVASGSPGYLCKSILSTGGVGDTGSFLQENKINNKEMKIKRYFFIIKRLNELLQSYRFYFIDFLHISIKNIFLQLIFN